MVHFVLQKYRFNMHHKTEYYIICATETYGLVIIWHLEAYNFVIHWSQRIQNPTLFCYT
jgi:hypothetical protein